MKSFKVSITSVLLSFFTLGTVYTQTALKLAFAINSGISRSGLPIQFGFRGKLGSHLAINGQIGNSPWRWNEPSNRSIATNVTLKDLKIRGKLAYGIDLRAYTSQGQTGFYGGIGFMRQQIHMETKTKLRSPSPGTNFASSANSWGGLLFGGLIDILTSTAGNTTIERVDKATVNAMTFDAGYAHAFPSNDRIEFGLKIHNRKISNVQYFVPTFEKPRAFDLDKIAKPIDMTIEVRYVVPII